jgi:hypothetical protein
MKKYKFVVGAVLVNRKERINVTYKKGDIVEFSDEKALEYMQMALITPYREQTPKAPTVPEIKEQLDILEIGYEPKAKKQELLELLESKE